MAWSHTYLAAVEAIRWFVLALLLWLGLNTLTRDKLPMLSWCIHGGAVAASFWAALQFWLDLHLFPQGPNPASTFVNRNFFAEYAVCALPFSVYALTSLRASRWLASAALSVALIVVGVMMTGTRSAMLAMAMLVPVLTLILVRYRHQLAFGNWRPRHKILVGLVLMASVLGMGSVPSGNPKIINEKTGTTALQRSLVRATSMGEEKEYIDGSFSMRTSMWKSTARMMMANPLAGVGAGAWEVQIPLYQRAGEYKEADYYAHNEFLQLLSEYGLVVGGLFLAVLFAYLLFSAGKTWYLRDQALEEAPLRAITLASLLALMMVSSAGFPWRLASTGVLFALCLAILAASDARLGIRDAFFGFPLRWRPWFSRAALTLLICCTVSAGYITQQAAEAERKIVSAIRITTNVPGARASDSQLLASQTAQMLREVREGIAINPHYRKLTAMVADTLALSGDWANALWIWESVAASRPHVAVIWLNIAGAHNRLGHYDQAQVALERAKKLESDIPGLLALEIDLISRTGHDAQATQMVIDHLDRGGYDFELVLVAYVLGLRTHNWHLAIRALELRNQGWPEISADAFFRMGSIYADPAVADDAKALAAFQAGLQAVPADQKDNFRKQVPEGYRTRL